MSAAAPGAAVEPAQRVDAGQPIGGYRFALSCPRCGRRLVHVASGTPGLDTRAVACCHPCRRHWGIVVTLVDVTDELGRPTSEPRQPECVDGESADKRNHRARQPRREDAA
jgi:hypothetical protein